VILSDTPSAYYRLGETSGSTAADSSGHGVNGTYGASKTLGTAGAIAGDTDKSATDTSTSVALMTAPSASLPSGNSARSLEVWMRTSGLGGSDFPIVGYGGVQLRGDWNNELKLYINGTFQTLAAAPFPMGDSNWHLYDLTFNGTTVTVYADGTTVLSFAVTISTDATSFALGPWTADFDEAAVYPAALSAARVAAHWTRGQSTSPSCATAPTSAYGQSVMADAPAAYYRLSDLASSANGRVAYDASANCQNGNYTAGTTNVSPGALAGDADTAAHEGTTVIRASTPSLPTGNATRTLEVWMRTSSLGASDFPIIGYGGVQLRGDWNNELKLYVNGSYQYLAGVPFAMGDGNWHLYDVTFNGSTASVFADGVFLYAIAATVSTDATPFAVGSWTADFDEAAVYPSALSTARISDHWTRAQSTNAACKAAPTSFYSRVILGDSPSAYYRLGDLASSANGRVAYDSSGKCINGYYQVGTTSVAGGAPAGDSDPAIHEASTVVQAPTTNLASGNAPRSLEVWMRMTSLPGDSSIISYGGVQLRANWNNELKLYVNGNYQTLGASPVAMADGNFHLYDLTFDGTTATVYADAIPVFTSNIVPASPPTSTLAVGPFVADFDEAAIYPTSLTGAQVYAHYRAGVPAPPAGGSLTNAEKRGKGPGSEPCNCQVAPLQKFGLNPIDASTGSFWHEFTDIAVPGRMALVVTRTYNAYPGETVPNGPFGYGWSTNYNLSLSVGGSSVTVNEEGGSQVVFNGSGFGPFTPASPRIVATLVHNGDGTWKFVRSNVATYLFDNAGLLTALKDTNANTLTVAHPNATTMTVTDAAGRRLTFTFASGRITTVTDSSSPARTVTYQYNDGQGNLTDVIDVATGHTQFAYDANHRMVTWRTARFYGGALPPPLATCASTPPANVISNHYDAQGRLDCQVDAIGRKTSYDYTSIANSTKVTDPAGNVTVQLYAYGRVIQRTNGYGTTQAAVWTYTYDPNVGTVTEVIDPNGHATRFTYDASANPLTAIDPLGRLAQSTYNAFNEPLTQTDGNNVTTTFTYDGNGNVLSASTPLLNAQGQVIATAMTSYHRDDATHLDDATSIVDANGKTWLYTYTADGELSSSTDPLTNKSINCFNSIGWRSGVITPKAVAASKTCASLPAAPATPPADTSVFGYDKWGHATTTVDSLGHKTLSHYDLDINLDSTTDGNNYPTTYTYDAAQQRTAINRADSSVLPTAYDADGNISSQTDGALHAVSYQHTNAAFPHVVTRFTDSLGRATDFTFDADGNQLTKQDPGGNCAAMPKVGCTTYGYDAVNQLTSTVYSDGTTPNVTSVVYDGDGHRTSMTDGSGASTWAYDSLGRLRSSTTPTGGTISYDYDLRKQLTTIVYPNGAGTVTRGYDDAGRVNTVQDWLSNTTTFNYDANSFLTSEVLPNGTTATNTPDSASRLMTIKDAPTLTPNSPYAKFVYTRDGNDQVTSVASTGNPGVPSDNHTWVYNSLNQLNTDTATPVAFGYDSGDNLTQLTTGSAQTFDVANQLTTSSAITLVGTAAKGDGGSTGSLTIPLPTGTAANDQTLVAVTVPFSQSVTTPTGYTVVGTYTSGSLPTSAKVVVYRRTNVAGDTNVVINFGAQYAKVATVATYRGVSTSQPIDVSAFGFANAGTSVTVPSVTTTSAADRLVVVQGAENALAAGTWTKPAGMTQQIQKAGGTSVAGAIADQPLGAGGATGTRVPTFSQTAELVAVSLALKPAPSSYGYDTRGNRTTLTPPTGSATTYTYDQANRLTAAGASTYAYTPNGLRKSKTVSGVTSTFSWDVADALPQLLVDGSTKYVYGADGLPLEQINGTTVLYFNHDQLGSTRTVTNSAGAVVATYTYDPYGRLAASTGSITNPFGYAGQYTDAETGFQYLRARYYDPTTGQFLSLDPLGPLTRDLYGYAGRSPLDRTDPTGMLGFSDITDAVSTGLDAVSEAANVVQVTSDVLAMGSAAVGFEPGAAFFLTVSESAGAIGTAATCANILFGGATASDCLTTAVINLATFGMGRLAAPERVGKYGVTYHTVNDYLIQGGINLCGDIMGWTFSGQDDAPGRTVRGPQ
jgi:RHS repeat-associated protein